ncbi:hypothetical protein [Burkholderia anthina]|uniref:hypothetical protein n=1 Tax=Burkholderia anthina TaxID=179879 RepID=UPI000A8FA22E|nr:hypothetical protein [Burkholderia anthina]
MAKKSSTALAPLIAAVKESKDTLIEVANIGLEAATSSEVFSKVPVLGAIVSVVGFCDAAMSLKLRRNVAAFLGACGKVPQADLDRLYEKVMGDPRFRDEVPDTIIQLMLDSHKPIKAEIVGRLFGGLASGNIQLSQFNDLALLVLSASVPALMALPSFFEGNANRPFLSRGGQLEQEPLLISVGIASRFGNMFRVNESGILLYEIGFGAKVDRST